ncbi:MAG: sulfotransferase family 2 domain-containing protein [Pseudomonadota bacterium]
MIYSPGRGYLFIHVPKTGGTSLALALEAKAQAGDIMAGDTPKATKRRGRLKGLPAKGRLWKHSTLSDLEGWLDREFERLYIFTLVRNPWDRVVSYYHWLRLQSFDHPAVTLAKAHDFAGFLEQAHTRAALSRSPYGSYVSDARGREHCARFVRLEHLDADIPALSADLGIKLDMPHVNRSERPGDYREAYDSRTQALVAEFCAADIARFGYQFDAGD